ncbi:MAG: sporulation protein YabP [Oscillospiraceae bacterium]|nr:sporulation protein YabP [Oscillospiraceae bacterium]
MGTEMQRQEPHELRLEERKKLSVTGVREVESFDEETVIMHTVCGVLIVRGQELHLQTLSIDGGCVAVDGTIEALSYAEPQKRGGGFFSRLFR